MAWIKVFSGDKEFLLNSDKGKNLLELLRENEIGIAAPCGGKGSCGKCKVKVTGPEGELLSLSESEKKLLSNKEIAAGIRLACKVRVINNLQIELLPENLIDGRKGKVLTRGRFESINWKPGIGEKLNRYGVVVDLGTTTIVIYLINLLTGEEMDREPLINPQQSYGADVISRINYVLMEKEGRCRLQKILIKALNQGIERLVERNNLKKNELFSASIAGNTVMLHLLRGINVESLARAPYQPVFTAAQKISPGEIGIEINNKGRVYLLPSISAFVGADIVADLLVCDFKEKGWFLLLDIGTNGEIVLGNQQQILACATAAGPAFEGANISCGMPGIKGAISHYRYYRNGQREYKTIGGDPPRGVCGSGLVDIIAALLRAGIIDKTGAFTGKKKSFLVLPARETASGQDLILTQRDIREFQLAVGAIRAGISILMKEASITFKKIRKIYLAGGFGNFLGIENACLTGIIPFQLQNRIFKIGNGAGSGAKLYLIDREARREAELFREKAVYIELAGHSDFQKQYLKSLEFPTLN